MHKLLLQLHHALPTVNLAAWSIQRSPWRVKNQVVMILICHITWSNSHNLKPTSFHHNRGKQSCQWARLYGHTTAGHFSLKASAKAKGFCGRWASSVKHCSGDYTELSLLSYATSLTDKSKMQGRYPSLVRKPYSWPSDGIISSL